MSEIPRPRSLEAELSVLGGMLLDNEHIEAARTIVSREDFDRHVHGVIFDAILELRRRKSEADIVTLTAYLRQANTLEDCGGPAYIASLTDGVPFSVNVPHYARIVKEHAIRRELIEAGKRAIRAAGNTAATVDELLDETEAALAAIGRQQATDLTAGPELAREAANWLEELATRHGSGRMSGVPTGIPDLDALTDGLQPGDLIMIGARPSQGKTALALQLALTCDGPCAFFSLEMRKAQLSARALAMLARVDGWALRRGRLSSGEYERVSRAMTTLSESGLAIDDASDLTVWNIRSKCRRWKVAHGLSLVVIDYLQLVTPPRDKRAAQKNREQEVAQMSRAFKALAKDIGVPVLLLAQLNRNVEGRAESQPKLSDLRESGSLEQDADLVMFLHRPGGKSVKDEGEAHLIVAKHRNGPTGTVPVYWIPAQTRFAPMGSTGERE